MRLGLSHTHYRLGAGADAGAGKKRHKKETITHTMSHDQAPRWVQVRRRVRLWSWGPTHRERLI